MSPRPAALQLYTVREAAEKDFAAVLDQVASFGYKAVEFAGLHGMSPADVRKKLDDLGLVSCSNHGPLPDKANLSQLVDQAKTLGYDWHVVSSMGPDKYNDEDQTRRTAEALQQGAALLKPHGVRVAVHNHWWEFDKRFNGKTPHQLMMELASDVFAQLDTYWTVVGGDDPVEVIRKLGSRAPLLHVKDGPAVRDQPMTAVGAGKMDWGPIFAAAAPTLQWPIVELDFCATDMMTAVRESCRYLVSQGYAEGK